MTDGSSTSDDLYTNGGRLVFQNVRDDVLYRVRLTTAVTSISPVFSGTVPGPGNLRAGQYGSARFAEFPIPSDFDIVSRLAITLSIGTSSVSATIISQSVMTWEFLGSDIPASAKGTTGYVLSVDGILFSAADHNKLRSCVWSVDDPGGDRDPGFQCLTADGRRAVSAVSIII